VVEQILGVTDELALRVEGKAAAEGISGTLIECFRVELTVYSAPLDLVRRELVAPAGGVPDAGVVRSGRDGAIDEREPISVPAATRDQQCGEVFERFDVRRIEVERLAGQFDARGDVTRRVADECSFEERPRLIVLRGQCSPSTSFRASCSSNTRNELVRTFPWLLTASETRVIVSSSGASAMTT
jgi:hypothetical protein